MSEAETTRKRIDVAKPCCGRKRGHAPECKSAPQEAPPAEIVAAVHAEVAEAYAIPPSGFTALLDAFLDDVATRIAAKLRPVPTLKVVSAPSAEHYVIEPKPTPEPKPAPEPTPTAAPIVEPKPTVVEKGSADAAACDKAKPTKKEYVAPKPCTGCGKDESDPKEPHTSACTVANPPKPKEDAPPAFEVLREAAVEYATKHSKEKLMDILEKYGAKGPEGVKLSLLPADKRAAFLAEVKP